MLVVDQAVAGPLHVDQDAVSVRMTATFTVGAGGSLRVDAADLAAAMGVTPARLRASFLRMTRRYWAQRRIYRERWPIERRRRGGKPPTSRDRSCRWPHREERDNRLRAMHAAYRRRAR